MFINILVHLYSSLRASSPFGGYHEKLACSALVASPLVCVILALLAFLTIWNGELGCKLSVYNKMRWCSQVYAIALYIECAYMKHYNQN